MSEALPLHYRATKLPSLALWLKGSIPSVTVAVFLTWEQHATTILLLLPNQRSSKQCRHQQ